jgi:outer membrane protein OmpA-like peptidoglycan-associated protein
VHTVAIVQVRIVAIAFQQDEPPLSADGPWRLSWEGILETHDRLSDRILASETLEKSMIMSRRGLFTGSLAAAMMLQAGLAEAQSDNEMTRMLRDLAPHDRAPAGAAPRRRTAVKRQLRLRGGGGSVTVDISRRVEITVFFDLNSAELRAGSQIALDRLSQVLSNSILLDQQFLIAGHTSADGDYDFNVALSHDRAHSVRNWLIGQGGIASPRLTANGFGPDMLRNPNNPASPINRRVEVIAID